MAIGNYTVFNLALPKLSGTINLGSDGFKLALTTASQAITHAFAGSSGAARYADLTAELTTANGYTVGGLALTSVTWTQTGGIGTFTSANAAWSITGLGITFRYGIIYDTTAANKDLLCFFDGGASLTAPAGPLTIAQSPSGIFTLTQTNPQD